MDVENENSSHGTNGDETFEIGVDEDDEANQQDLVQGQDLSYPVHEILLFFVK